jgi:proliferating cell nuclear antigen PCNA
MCVKSDELDNLHIDFTNINPNNSSKSNINKYFTLPLQETDSHYELTIPENEYEVDITMNSKKLCELINQLSSFSDDLHDANIIANLTSVKFITQGATGGEFIIEIDPENIDEYAIIDNIEINVSYSLKYLHKLCLTNKISNDIKISMSNKSPMKIKYDLGDDSELVYFITPKIEE